MAETETFNRPLAMHRQATVTPHWTEVRTPFMKNTYPYVICDMRQASFGASFGCRKLLSVASRYAEKLATERGHGVGVWSDLSSKYMAAFAPDQNTHKHQY
jgi:hypothetical protein